MLSSSSFRLSSSSLSKICIFKTGLKTLVNVSVFNEIQKNVLEISQLNYEASLLIYFILHKEFQYVLNNCNGSFNFKKINFYQYFEALVDNNLQIIYPAFYNIRQYTKIYNKNHVQELYKHQVLLYEKMFEKNLYIHAKKRLTLFLANNYPKETKNVINYNVMYLFGKNENYKSNLNMLLNPLFPWWTEGYFANVYQDPYFYLYDFYLMWKLNCLNNWKNFQLIPMFKLKRHFVTYNLADVNHLLSQISFPPPPPQQQQTTMKNVFKLKQPKNIIEISTDGVSCAIKYTKSTFFNDCQKQQQQQQQQQNPKTSVNIGIDPGLRLLIGGVRTTNNDIKGPNLKIKYKMSKFYHESGIKVKKYNYYKWTNQSRCIENFRPANQTPLEFVTFELRHFKEKSTEMLKQRLARLKFDTYIRTQKTIQKIIKQYFIKNETSKITVYVGSEINKHKNHRDVQHMLLHALKTHQQINYVEVDEFKTTKVCSKCQKSTFHIISQKPHRYTNCKNCNVVWNRDINAALNILYMGYYGYKLK